MTKKVVEAILLTGKAPHGSLSDDHQWLPGELEALVDFGGRKLSIFQFAIVRNRKSMAEKILQKVRPDSRSEYLKEQFKAIETENKLYEGETIFHFAAMHAAQRYSGPADPDSDVNKDPGDECTLHFLLELLPEISYTAETVLGVYANGLLYTRERIPQVFSMIKNVKRNCLNAGCTPFALAVCLQSRRIVNYMLKQDSSLLKSIDPLGNNVVHRLAAQMKRICDDVPPDAESLQKMFTFLMKKEAEYFPGSLVKNDCLLRQRNCKGYRPIHVATYNGNVPIFKSIVSSPSVRTLLVDYDTMKLAAYRLEDLDSQSERESGYDAINVLDVAISSPEPDATAVLSIAPMPQLTELKWQTYGSVGFSYMFFINLIYLIALSAAAYYRPLMYSVCDAIIDPEQQTFVRNQILSGGTNVSYCMPWTMRPFLDSYRTTSDYTRLFAEILVILITLLHFYSEVYDFFKVADLCPQMHHYSKVETSEQQQRPELMASTPLVRHAISYSLHRIWDGSMGRNVGMTVVKWMTIILAVVAVPMRMLDDAHQDVVLALLVFTAYLYSAVYARDFKFSGPYVIVIYHIFKTVIIRFLVIFLFANIAFGLFFLILFQESYPERPHEYETFARGIYQLFRTTISLSDLPYESIRSPHVASLAIAFFIIFLIFCVILLVNFLIALMNSLQTDTLAEAKLIWRRSIIASLFMVERRTPVWVPFHPGHKKIGLRGRDLLLPDKRREHRPKREPNDHELRYLLLHEPDAPVPQACDKQDETHEPRAESRQPQNPGQGQWQSPDENHEMN